LAGSYSKQNAEQDQWFGGDIDLKSYSVAAFASLSYPNIFLDGILSYGSNSYDITRPGVISPLQASPNGNSLLAAIKTGYLFGAGGFRVGPIAGLTYGRVTIDSYDETGDPLLDQRVGKQNVDALIGSLGLQARHSAGPFEIFANVTLEHDFEDELRKIITAQVYAPNLPITTLVGRGDDRNYGKVTGGFSANLSANLSLMLSGETTFARDDQDYAVSGGLKLSF
jgi:outer membrane autotransporter protein